MRYSRQPANKLYMLIDHYFEIFEQPYYHPAYLDSARRKFKQYVSTSGELNKVILGYIEIQREILKNNHNCCFKDSHS